MTDGTNYDSAAGSPNIQPLSEVRKEIKAYNLREGYESALERKGYEGTRAAMGSVPPFRGGNASQVPSVQQTSGSEQAPSSTTSSQESNQSPMEPQT